LLSDNVAKYSLIVFDDSDTQQLLRDCSILIKARDSIGLLDWNNTLKLIAKYRSETSDFRACHVVTKKEINKIYFDSSNYVFCKELTEIFSKGAIHAVSDISHNVIVKKILLGEQKSKITSLIRLQGTGIINSTTTRLLQSCTAMYCLRDSVAADRWFKNSEGLILSLKDTTTYFADGAESTMKQGGALVMYQNYIKSMEPNTRSIDAFDLENVDNYTVVELLDCLKLSISMKEFSENHFDIEYNLVSIPKYIIIILTFKLILYDNSWRRPYTNT
jgi:hypothetical protein